MVGESVGGSVGAVGVDDGGGSLDVDPDGVVGSAIFGSGSPLQAASPPSITSSAAAEIAVRADRPIPIPVAFPE